MLQAHPSALGNRPARRRMPETKRRPAAGAFPGLWRSGDVQPRDGTHQRAPQRPAPLPQVRQRSPPPAHGACTMADKTDEAEIAYQCGIRDGRAGVERKCAHGNSDRHRSMVVESRA